MIKFVVGPKGSGKTKWLIDQANEQKKEGNGNIVFIDSDEKHIFSLDHDVRLIDASQYSVSDQNTLYGFLAGIVSRDNDIEKVYLDGVYSIVEFEDIDKFLEKLEELSANNKVDFLIGMNKAKDELPENYKNDAVELEA
ncbi:MAG: hypothetical protein SPI59_04255 [Finegoldia sp.]|nr:hypothetical protein [Finegoldia sp.]